MRIRWRILACLCLGGLLVWFLADAGAVRDSVAEALALCARSVVPSLFPFLVASSALLALGFGELAAPWLAGLMEPLFRVPGAGSAALVLGLVGGYPIGAKTAADLYRENLVSREERSGCWPSQQLQSGVPHQCAGRGGVRQCAGRGVAVADPCALRPSDGTGVSGQRKIRFPAGADKASSFPGCQLCGGLHRGCPVLACRDSVCVRLRGVLLCAGAASHRRGRPPGGGPGGGAGALLPDALLTADAFGFLLAAAAAGWGGLSVLCQTLAVLEGSGLRLRNCFLGKVVQSAFSLLLAALLVGYVLG